jgi:hypothetical protein
VFTSDLGLRVLAVFGSPEEAGLSNVVFQFAVLNLLLGFALSLALMNLCEPRQCSTETERNRRQRASPHRSAE